MVGHFASSRCAAHAERHIRVQWRIRGRRFVMSASAKELAGDLRTPAPIRALNAIHM
jgi:hypothetical protein